MAKELPPAAVTDDVAASRYEAVIGDRRAGLIAYELRPGRMVMLHTEVEPEFEGHGVAGEMVARALDDVRARGLKVVPSCPYVRSYISRHPEYADLLAAGTDRR